MDYIAIHDFPFGDVLVPATISMVCIFQRTMEMVVKGLPMVVAYLVDILVAGKTE